jgi:hypothetical protein
MQIRPTSRGVGLEALRPGQMADPRMTGHTGRGPDPAPLTPRLPLPPEPRGIYDLGLMIYDLKKNHREERRGRKARQRMWTG